MKPIEFYMDRYLSNLEEDGDTAQAAFERAILERCGSHNFVEWCKQGDKNGFFDKVSSAFDLHGFETADERVGFFASNHKIIEPYFMRSAKQRRQCVQDSIIVKGIDKHVSGAPLWTDVFDSLNNHDINDIFFDNNTHHPKYHWMVNNFMGWFLLTLRFNLKWRVIDDYLARLEE